MPTEPIEGLLNREGARDIAEELIEMASPVLQEIVNQATHVHSRCELSTSGEPDIYAPPFLLFRHMIEMIDGVEVLISRSCVIPAEPLLRSAFEAGLELEYMLEENFRDRSLAWIYCYSKKKILRLGDFDPGTNRGARLQEAWEDELGEPPTIPADSTETTKDQIEGLRELIEQSRFEGAADAYQAAGGRPDWYELYGGPSTLEQVAEQVNRQTEYEIFYRKWSRTAHPQNLFGYIYGEHPDDPDRALINPIRFPKSMLTVASTSAALLLRAMMVMLRHFRPGDSLSSWYISEVRDAYRQLTRTKVKEHVTVADRF